MHPADPNQRPGEASSPLAAALAHARRGMPVFPVNREKEPLTSRGFYNATISPSRIRSFYRRHPRAGVAVRTGAASGIVELDLDSRDAMERAMRSIRASPECVTLTGRGFRMRFAAPERPLRSFVPWPGAELIAEGRYVIVPPSVHPSGYRYSYLAHGADDPLSLELAPLPAWLIEMGRNLHTANRDEQPARPVTTTANGSTITEGSRNRTLFRIGCSLRGDGADHASILAHLHEANRLRANPPLAGAEIDKIAHSIAGRYQPGKKP